MEPFSTAMIMATYAIGDLQGCFRGLQHLLEAIGYNETRDRLWLVGDLINRGPHSLAVLRWAMGQGERLTTVLGNHDLHLLMVSEAIGKPSDGDTLDEILAAPDRDTLLAWLRAKPLLVREDDYVLVHAGLYPLWNATQAEELGEEVRTALSGPHFRRLLARMYGNEPHCWDDALTGEHRMRFIINAMTRMRYLTADGGLDLKHKGPPAQARADLIPWFDFPTSAPRNQTVLCGHWSALGLMVRPDVIALDTGCLWGGKLTAVRLEDRRIFQVSCEEAQTPTHRQ